MVNSESFNRLAAKVEKLKEEVGNVNTAAEEE
jgi:hypothetical protein